MDAGEDAFFVLSNLLAVADGVGGWRDSGVDPSHFSNALMAQIMEEAFATPPNNAPTLTPHSILGLGVRSFINKFDRNSFPKGSCTVTMAGVVDHTRDGQPAPLVQTTVFGDSGVAIVRDGRVIWRARELQHYFNCPFQFPPDDPARATNESFAANEGDIVIVATDGLFDNLYNDIVGQVVLSCTDNATGVDVRRAADALLVKGIQVAKNPRSRTPWMDGYAQARNSRNVMFGGKVDDVTVLVGKVERAV